MPFLCLVFFLSLYGFCAQAAGIVSARFILETDHYDHCVLGDCIEYGAVEAVLDDGRILSYRLDDNAVFEDIEPRLIPMGLNGRAALLVVRSSLKDGASLIILDVRRDKLKIVAESPAIGKPHRWQNPIGVADFDHDGILEIATVITPHIGGTLTLYERQGRKLVKDHEAFAFSNHKIGSSEIDLGEIIDWNGDGTKDILLPDVSRHKLHVVSFATGKAQIIDTKVLELLVTGPIVAHQQGVKFITSDGNEDIWLP